MKPLDLRGKQFNRLTVISRDYSKPISKSWWKCKCACGRVKSIRGTRLTAGNTQSCGCLANELSSQRLTQQLTTHNLSRSVTADSWYPMMTRCRNESDPHFLTYGAIGIRVCEFLAQSPQSLIDTIGERPSRKVTIDRWPNNDGHYSCGKCAECIKNGWPFNIRWATQKEQMRNSRRTHRITIDGVTRCAVEWAEFFGVDYKLVKSRLRSWKGKRIFLTPKRIKGVRIPHDELLKQMEPV